MYNKSTLIDALSAALKQNEFHDLSRSDIRTAVDLILSRIGEAVAEGDRVEIRGFGVFSHNDLPGRHGRNPRTGEPVIVPPKRAIHFKPGLDLRHEVDRLAKVQNEGYGYP